MVGAGKAYDNAKPRGLKDGISSKVTLDQEVSIVPLAGPRGAILTRTELCGITDGNNQKRDHFIRAQHASENGYETLGLFAAAVVAGNVGRVHLKTLNAMTWGYVATRVVYNYLYICLGNNPKTANCRSMTWFVSMVLSAGLFVGAGCRSVVE